MKGKISNFDKYAAVVLATKLTRTFTLQPIPLPDPEPETLPDQTEQTKQTTQYKYKRE